MLTIENRSQVPALRQEALLALPGKKAALGMLTGDFDGVVQILIDTPDASGYALAAAYYNPAIFRGLDQMTTVPSLAQLKAQFPDTRAHLTDARVATLLRDFPYRAVVETRIAEDRVLFPEDAQVSQAEVLLRQLITDGNLTQLDSEDYSKVFVSAELFNLLATSLLGSGADNYEHIGSFDEERRFASIGNRLRKIVKLFELGTDRIDVDYITKVVPDSEDVVATARREKEFQARVGVLKQAQRLHGVLSRKSAIPHAADRAQSLSQGIVWMMEMLLKDFPDKEGLIALEFGTLENSKKIARHAEHPGAPYMSPAEIFDRQI